MKATHGRSFLYKDDLSYVDYVAWKVQPVSKEEGDEEKLYRLSSFASLELCDDHDHLEIYLPIETEADVEATLGVIDTITEALAQMRAEIFRVKAL